MMTLRERLRTETADVHRTTEAAFARLDLSDPIGRDAFSRAQIAAYERLGQMRVDDPGRTPDLISAVTGTVAPPSSPTDTTPPLHGLAVDYVLLGARLGLAMLRRQWLAAGGDADARLFNLPDEGAAWRSLVARLTAMPAEGREADRILADAKRVFALFREAALSAPRADAAQVG